MSPAPWFSKTSRKAKSFQSPTVMAHLPSITVELTERDNSLKATITSNTNCCHQDTSRSDDHQHSPVTESEEATSSFTWKTASPLIRRLHCTLAKLDDVSNCSSSRNQRELAGNRPDVLFHSRANCCITNIPTGFTKDYPALVITQLIECQRFHHQKIQDHCVDIPGRQQYLQYSELLC